MGRYELYMTDKKKPMFVDDGVVVKDLETGGMRTVPYEWDGGSLKILPPQEPWATATNDDDDNDGEDRVASKDYSGDVSRGDSGSYELESVECLSSPDEEPRSSPVVPQTSDLGAIGALQSDGVRGAKGNREDTVNQQSPSRHVSPMHKERYSPSQRHRGSPRSYRSATASFKIPLLKRELQFGPTTRGKRGVKNATGAARVKVLPKKQVGTSEASGTSGTSTGQSQGKSSTRGCGRGRGASQSTGPSATVTAPQSTRLREELTRTDNYREGDGYDDRGDRAREVYNEFLLDLGSDDTNLLQDAFDSCKDLYTDAELFPEGESSVPSDTYQASGGSDNHEESDSDGWNESDNSSRNPSPTRNPSTSPNRNRNSSQSRNPSTSPNRNRNSSQSRNPSTSPNRNRNSSQSRNPSTSPNRNRNSSQSRNPNTSPNRNRNSSQSQNADAGDRDSRGRPRSRANKTWAKEDALELIRLYGKNRDAFYDNSTLKQDVWKRLAPLLHPHSAKSCDNKWNTLVSKYKDKLASMGATRTGGEPVEFDLFDEMDAVMKGEPQIKPPLVASSTRDAAMNVPSSYLALTASEEIVDDPERGAGGQNKVATRTEEATRTTVAIVDSQSNMVGLSKSVKRRAAENEAEINQARLTERQARIKLMSEKESFMKGSLREWKESNATLKEMVAAISQPLKVIIEQQYPVAPYPAQPYPAQPYPAQPYLAQLYPSQPAVAPLNQVTSNPSVPNQASQIPAPENVAPEITAPQNQPPNSSQ